MYDGDPKKPPPASAGAPGGEIHGRPAHAPLPVAEVAYWLSGAAILVYALAIAVPNVFVIDGFIYLSMVEALVEHGSLAVENGWQDYRSPALALYGFLVPVGDRLMPQYPSGWAVLAAPFYALGGIRGLFLLNALATVLTLWLIRVLGRTLFADDTVGRTAAILYAVATFAFDYAGAVWPHAVAIALATGAMAAAATGWQREREERQAGAWFLLAGLLIGLAVHARVDSILALPAIAFWTLGATRRPWRNLALLALGLAPGLVAAAALNWVKFGILNPLSYGRDGARAAISLGFYQSLLPLALAAVIGAAALSVQRVRRVTYRPAAALTLLAAVVVAALALPGLGDLVLRLAKGAAVLFVNIELFPELLDGRGLRTLEDGTVVYYGWAKKALLQSLPYAAVILLVLPALFRGPHRAGVALCLLLAGAVLLPFALSAWIGGRANHMRYLLLATPALLLLSALAMHQIAERARGATLVAAAAGVAATLLGIVIGLLRLPDPVVVLQRSVPNVLVLAIAVLAVLALVAPLRVGRPVHAVLRGTVAAGVVVAAVSAWVLDFAAHQSYRADNRDLALAIRALPERALFSTLYPTFAYERVGTPGTLFATTHGLPARFDPALIRQALADGLPVFVQHPEVARQVVEAGLARSAEQVTEGEPWYQLFRLVPAEPDA